MCYFKVELQHITACVPQRRWNGFCLRESCERLLHLLLPTKSVRTREMPCRLPRILSSKSTSLVVRGRNFLIQTRQVLKSSSLIGFSHLDCLQSWGQNLRFWSLRLSLRQADFQEEVVSELVCKHHPVLCLLSQRFLSFLRWCWFGLLLPRVYRMGWAFQPS